VVDSKCSERHHGTSANCHTSANYRPIPSHSLLMSQHKSCGKECNVPNRKGWRQYSKWPRTSLQPCTSCTTPAIRRWCPFQDISSSNASRLKPKNGEDTAQQLVITPNRTTDLSVLVQALTIIIINKDLLRLSQLPVRLLSATFLLVMPDH